MTENCESSSTEALLIAKQSCIHVTFNSLPLVAAKLDSTAALAAHLEHHWYQHNSIGKGPCALAGQQH